MLIEEEPERYTRQFLPLPQILLIEQEPEGYFLYRFTSDGRFGGDTWHMTMNDAVKQAAYEYGDSLGEWHTIPEEVSDPLAFAQGHVTQQEYDG